MPHRADPTIDPVPLAALAIVNARIWTGDRRRPWADAILVRGDLVAMVGSSAEVKKGAAGVQTIDARGMMVLPAFDPAHPDGWRDAPGVLAAGKAAELVMVDRDLTGLSPEAVRDARVVLRLAGGCVVDDGIGLTA